MRPSSGIIEDLSTGTLLKSLSIFKPAPADLERLGLSAGPLKLRRAWPRSFEQLGLEYVAGDGRIIPGQWFGRAQRLEHIAQATIKASPNSMVSIVNVGDMQVLLQAGGADRRLPGLAPLLQRPGAQLLVHQPERRAVVRFKTSGELRYAKVVRPERTQRLAITGSAIHYLAAGAFTAPKLIGVDVEAGVIVWSVLPGTSLYELLDSTQLISAARNTGHALRMLHTATPPARITLHTAIDEIKVLRRWLDRLKPFAPDLYHQLRQMAVTVFEALADDTPSTPVLLHRDFYDKQIFIDAAGQVGLLDFDTLAIGEAALDLANALVHLELRTLQGRCLPKQAIAARFTLLDGYQPDPSINHRLIAYAKATRLRLACVYAFRPQWKSLIPALLDQIGGSGPNFRRRENRVEWVDNLKK